MMIAVGSDENYYTVTDIVRHNSDFAAFDRGEKITPPGIVVRVWWGQDFARYVEVKYPNGGGITDQDTSFRRVTREELVAERMMT